MTICDECGTPIDGEPCHPHDRDCPSRYGIPVWASANLAVTTIADCHGITEDPIRGPFGWCIYDMDEDDPALVEFPAGSRADAEFVLNLIRQAAADFPPTGDCTCDWVVHSDCCWDCGQVTT